MSNQDGRTPEFGLDRLHAAAAPALGLAGAEGVEVVVRHSTLGLTRFANSQIHQNVHTEDLAVRMRVVAGGGRVGVVEVAGTDRDEVRRAAEQALAAARLAPADPDFPGLAPAAPVPAPPEPDPATLATGPAERAQAVRALLTEVPAAYEAAGAYATGAVETAVFTSAGQAVAATVPSAQLTTVVAGPTSSGWAEAGGRSVTDIDPRAAGRRAVGKAVAGAQPTEVDPGDWPVVLEPAATGALIEFLAYLGFGGRAWLERRACTSGRLGERALHPTVTIVDDALSPDAAGFPFDAEGTAKQRVDLVRDGVLNAVVHDRATGAKTGTASTGHALPAPNTWGPLPVDPRLLPGDGGSVDDLIAGMDRGLLITRFHYVNVVHPLETVLTGMTRDGTFLVSEGRVVAAVRNLRFQQSVLAALATVDAIGTDTEWTSEIFGGSRSPGVRLPRFTFASTTTFG